MNKHKHTQPSKLALQATPRPINEKASCAPGLTDSLTRSQTLQKWLSGATNGIPCQLLPLHTTTIHNYQLSIKLPPIGADVLEHATIPPCCSGTPTEQRQQRYNDHARSSVDCRRSGRSEAESIDRAGYTSKKKARGHAPMLLSILTPSLSAPTVKPPCQDQSTERATTLPTWRRSRPDLHPCRLPALHDAGCTSAYRSPLGGAEQVTRTALSAFLESEVLRWVNTDGISRAGSGRPLLIPKSLPR